MKNRSNQTYINRCLNGSVKFTDTAPKSNEKIKLCKKRERQVPDEPSVKRFVKFKSNKSDAIQDVMQQQIDSAAQASIGIPYRPDKEGAGAVFDHQTFQTATNRPTAILNSTAIPRQFDKAIRERPNFLQFGTNDIDATGFKFPPVSNQFNHEIGLLAITGVSADSFVSAEYKIRHQAETEMIRLARLRGQPILGICGGSWTLYQAYGGKIVSVEGHAYRGGMPRLGKNDSVVTCNKPLHRLRLAPSKTLLQAALRVKLADGETVKVNSVHSYAPSTEKIPGEILISATALADATLAPSNAKPTEEGTIEAFETKHGAPVLGVQWHPEAYESNTEHGRLMQYMMFAGQAYANKRRMLTQFHDTYNEAKANLKKTNKISCHNSIKKIKTKGYINYKLYKFKLSDEYRHEDEVRLEAELKMKYLAEEHPNIVKNAKR